MGERFRDSTTWPERWPVLVRCPRCDGCARAQQPPDPARNEVRLSCTSCGLVRSGRAYGVRPSTGDLLLHPLEDGRTWRDPDTREIWTWPDAPEVGLTLWLRAPCCGEVLWAANEEHLAYLEDAIGATLRERPEARISPMGRRWVGMGLSSKLPDWMKAAKHRDEVMSTLAKLRATLPEGG